MRTFHRLVANTLLAGMTNNLIWFALTFWAYLETKSVIATSVVGGAYMLMLAGSGLYFGTFVDRHRRRTSMLVSSVASLTAYALAGALYLVTPAENLRDLGRPEFWGLTLLVLAGAVAGNLRTIALSTSVTLLVPQEQHARANGLVGTVNGISFALTSVFSGLAIGLLGMGWSLLITLTLTGLALAHLSTISLPEPAPEPQSGNAPAFDLRGALAAVRAVPGLLAILYFSTFNNLLGGVFMALMDPYGLTLVSVEAWGVVLAISSAGFIIGGLIVARRGLGARPVRVLLLANMAMWTVTILFPIRSSIVMLTIGFLIYLILIPVAESAEQTVIQRVVPLATQGRVFGFAQSLETAASPVTSFLIGPIAQVWVIPFMTTGAGAATIGGWFGTGPDRAMALLFIGAGLIGLVMTIVAMRSRAYTALSARYADTTQASPAAAQAPSRDQELELATAA
ncbi:MFS transporter [Micromonospora sp. CPCC 206061]|uniref:MFS transporter n=1 Tax=Micromonospora sp. CPCC 206061 TaxID=3122410 RepID=UPI002FF3C7F0